VRWSLSAAQWSELSSPAGAFSLSVGVTNALRASTYTADSPVVPANTTLRSGVYATPEMPFELRETFTELASRLGEGSAPYKAYELTMLVGTDIAGGSGGGTVAAASVSAFAQADSAALLLLTSSFQAQSFMDPLTLKNYVRARWYDPATSVFLTPDPLGYADSSNLYAFAAGDPINNRDPRGEGIGEWLSEKYNRAADSIDETVEMVMEGTDDSQWFTRSAAQTMQLASGFLRSGTQSGTELGEGKSAWQVVQNRVYEGMPLEEARALIQDWDYLSDADKARLISMGISKTASVIVGARGLQQIASGAATVATPKPTPRLKINLVHSKPRVRMPVAGLTTAGAIEVVAPVVPYNPEFAVQQLLGRTTTPGGRLIMDHAARRMTLPTKGRAPMTVEEVDLVLDTATKIKKISGGGDRITVTVQRPDLPGKPQVVVDSETGTRVVTVIKNN
jgi:RHS repeat-associated protein